MKGEFRVREDSIMKGQLNVRDESIMSGKFEVCKESIIEGHKASGCVNLTPVKKV